METRKTTIKQTQFAKRGKRAKLIQLTIAMIRLSLDEGEDNLSCWCSFVANIIYGRPLSSQ